MSRNFELLRKVLDEQVLLGQGTGYSPVIKTDARDREPGPTDDVIREQKSIAQAIARKPSEAEKEELVKLVRNAFLFPNSHAPRLVCFSSIERGGAAEICLRTAETLSQQVSGSICLVEGNVQAPSLHDLLGIRNTRGLVDAMKEPAPIIEYAANVGENNLWFLSLGATAGVSVAGLFGSERLRTRLAELKEQFDYVLMDAPTASLDGDAILLGQMTDGLILVLEANSTRRETARMIKENLDKAKVKILGAILNNRSFPIPEKLYRKL